MLAVFYHCATHVCVRINFFYAVTLIRTWYLWTSNRRFYQQATRSINYDDLTLCVKIKKQDGVFIRLFQTMKIALLMMVFAQLRPRPKPIGHLYVKNFHFANAIFIV